jgi:hypothetical protein
MRRSPPQPTSPRPPRRTQAGGAKKRPARYTTGPALQALARAIRAQKRGRTGEAEDAYREHLAREPGSLDALMNLAALAVLAGRMREAQALFARAGALAPGDARVQRDVGIGLAALGRFAEARVAFERAVADEGAPLGARLGLARACAALGDRAAAIAHAEDAVRAAPRSAPAHLELHRALFDDRAPEPCIAPAERAVLLDPGWALARFFLSGALRLAGRADEADAALGPEGLVARGLVDALAYATRDQEPRPRTFATTRETLRFALGEARGTGPVLELGVRHGTSVRILAEDGCRVHGFDSFQGLPEAWVGRAPGAFSTSGELPEVPPNVTLHVGLFEDTLPPFAARMTEAPRLVHVDSDLYSSARTALSVLGPRLEPGCVLVFDEYVGNATWRDDEHRAFREAAERFHWAWEELAVSWITGQGVVRLL